MEIKIQCDCGVKFKFDVEPVNGQMPVPVQCPECGADATKLAETQLAQLVAPCHGPADVLPATLRVIRPAHVSATIAPVEPAVYVVTPDSPPADEPSFCKYHPKSHARWMCLKCVQRYCELCVSSRPIDHRMTRLCRRCGAECSPLNIAIIPEGTEKQNFFANIPGAFKYPFTGSGLMFLFAGTLFFTLLEFLRAFAFFPGFAVWIIHVIYVGYTFAFVQKVIQSAAQGGDEPPSWPDITDFWQDISVPFLQMTALFLACFGPALGFIMFAGVEFFNYGDVGAIKLVLAGLLGLLGMIYFPMAFLALAMSDSVLSINPFVVIPAIMKIPLEYMAVLSVGAMIFSTKALQQVVVYFYPFNILPHLVASALGLYFLTVQGRLLGLMYYARRDRLGWFHHRPLP
jgi:hypothetical protein